jgi:DNA-directed RNA polymerase specialized sigma54-like protein
LKCSSKHQQSHHIKAGRLSSICNSLKQRIKGLLRKVSALLPKQDLFLRLSFLSLVHLSALLLKGLEVPVPKQ